MGEYGEGAIRMNAATSYLIKHARWAEKHWGLSREGLIECLERLRYVEHHRYLTHSISTEHALKQENSDAQD